MWRSGMFWRLYLISGGLLALAVLSAGMLIALAAPLGGSSETAGRNFHFQLWVTVGVVGIVGMVMAFWLTRRIVQPLHELTQGAKLIAAGDYGRKVFAEGSNEVGILAKTFNDTSERLAEQLAKMDDDRQQLRAVLSGMKEGVIAIDSNRSILFANERAGQLLGFSSESAAERSMWEVVRHRDVHNAIGSVLANTHSRNLELNFHGPMAKSLTMHANPLPGSPSRGAVLVLHDTTELRRLERLRQEFVANVSHELKTPLSVIKANVETLMDGAVDDIEHRGLFLQRIHEQADNLNRLIVDLLNLARVESGSETFVFQRVPIAEVIGACAKLRRPLAQAKQQTLELIEPDEAFEIWADEEAVFQIIDNLVDNAIKYTPENGNIAISWWKEEEWGVIEVRDTGVGIAEKELPRIFERFYRVDKARSRLLGGTGLGLSIVKHLAQAMHGSIQAKSEPNAGATFTVRLPRHET